MTIHSEDSYIFHDITVMFSEYGYPGQGDRERARIKEIPVKVGSKTYSPDIVFYQEGHPVLIVEAKRKGKSEADSKAQAWSYLKCYPEDEKWLPKGRKPKFIATAIGSDITFYRHEFEILGGELKESLERVSGFISWDELLREYGLEPEFKPLTLGPEDLAGYITEIVSIHKLRLESKFTAEHIRRAVSQVFSILRDGENWQARRPYTDLDGRRSRQAMLRHLARMYDLKASLNPVNATAFRKLMIQAFQGGIFRQYLTPQVIIDFMVDLVDPQPHWKALDFECGSGGFLGALISRGLQIENLRGIDIDELPCLVAKTYLAFLKGIKDEDMENIPIEKANGLLPHGNDWDLVISNPAGSQKYPHGNLTGIYRHLDRDLDCNGNDDPVREYNFSIQQAVTSIKVGGVICLILPDGFFTNSNDEFLRRYVGKYCQVQAIISLPRGVFKIGVPSRSGKRKGLLRSMKMSILLARKVMEVEKGSGIDGRYSEWSENIFIASVGRPSGENRRKSINEWLGFCLNEILERFIVWRRKGTLPIS